MGIKYSITESRITYPLINRVVEQKPLYNQDGTPKVTRTQKFLSDGAPDLELIQIGKKSDGVLVKRPRWEETPDLEDVIEALPDETLPPDGVTYKVLAWDEDDEATKIDLEFHIGKAVWLNYQSHQRSAVLRKEIEILYNKARADWTEGLELS